MQDNATYGLAILKYASQWLSVEKDLYGAFRGDLTGTTVEATASHFVVARNFPKKDRPNRYQEIRVILSSVVNENQSCFDRTVELTKKLASEELTKLTKRGRREFALSAASKFIWMIDRRNIILDSLMEDYLAPNPAESDDPKKRYSHYCDAWKDKFRDTDKIIRPLCDSVAARSTLICPNTRLKFTDASQVWFRMRVFDLWGRDQAS